MKTFYSLGLCLTLTLSAEASFHIGLGQAVAKHSAELVNKAGAYETQHALGDSVATTLASCGAGPVYTHLPTELSGIVAIVPLGNLAPTPHTLPSDHIYFYASTTTAETHPVFAPATIHITDIAVTEYLSASPSFSDYSIYFYACRELKSYFFHVRTLSPELASRIGTIDQNCSAGTTGTATTSRCNKETNIVLQEGELIGRSATNGAFDFGSYDSRVTPLPFASPARHYAQQAYTVCPIDYFSTGPKAAMEAMLGRYDGGFHRVANPLCGGIQYDIVGKARGDWYHVGSPDNPEDPHLALVPDNVDPTKQVFSIGGTVTGLNPAAYVFIPNTTGQVNRDFADVSADGQIYCYDSFYDPAGQAIAAGPTILIQMPTSSTLIIERQIPIACGAGPWAFTGNSVTFQR